MPALYRITEDQVLEAAGLDAYVVSRVHLLSMATYASTNESP